MSRVSPRGIAALKIEEGFRSKPYKDKAGKWTIGYGHKILPGETFTTITEAEGEQILLQDIAKAEAAIQGRVTVPLTPGQYDALVSLIFNIGVSAFAQSTLLQKLNAGDYQGAYDELARWNKITNEVTKEKEVDPVLVARRKREQGLFIA